MPAALADAEMKLTASVLTYAHHAAVGRMHWSRRRRRNRIRRRSAPEPEDVLARIADARTSPQPRRLRAAAPAGYKALKAQARRNPRRQGRDAGPTQIPSGPTLKFGDQDDRVCPRCAKLGLNGSGPATPTYDKALGPRGRSKFQQEHDIKVDRNARQQRPSTRSTAQDADDHATDTSSPIWNAGAGCRAISAQDLRHGQHPGLHAQRHARRCKQVWQNQDRDRQAGTRRRRCSRRTMKYITVNPTWNVPPSIVYSEYLPALQQDPTVLDRMGFKVSAESRWHRAHLAAAGRQQRARPHPLQLPEQVPGLSARHAGQEPVRAMTSAPTATAACACRIRRSTPRCCCRWCGRTTATPRSASRRCSARQRNRHPVADLHPGQPHLPDRVRRRDGKLAIPRRHLRPRQGADGDAQGRRAQVADIAGRAKESLAHRAGPGDAGPAVAIGRQRGLLAAAASSAAATTSSRGCSAALPARPPAPHKPVRAARRPVPATSSSRDPRGC